VARKVDPPVQQGLLDGDSEETKATSGDRS